MVTLTGAETLATARAFQHALPIVANGGHAVVPCGPCRECCRHNIIKRIEGVDEPADYLTCRMEDLEPEMTRHPQGVAMKDEIVLQQKPNGDCVYLTPAGCSIWERAPVVCRVFDCRKYVETPMGRKIASERMRRAARQATIRARKERKVVGRCQCKRSSRTTESRSPYRHRWATRSGRFARSTARCTTRTAHCRVSP